MKNSKNRKLILVLAILVVLFLAVVIYLAYFQLFRAKVLADNDLNMRNWVDESKVKRGDIYDINGTLLASSQKDTEGNVNRHYSYNYMYSNLIGYNSQTYGKSGIESSYNSVLLNYKNSNFFEQLQDIYNDDTGGKNIYLTVDNDLQSYAYDLLGDMKGSVIVTEAKTGKIKAMVTKPTYNVNMLEENWEEIIASTAGIMLNRPTQGLYEPGSVFKLFTSIAILENGIDENYEDKGSTTIGNYTINNYNYNVYGQMDLKKALATSSNAYFADKSLEISTDKFADIFNRFKIGREMDFDLPVYKSKIPYFSYLDDLSKAMTAFGQGNTQISPLDISMVGMAIANEGVVMKPSLIHKIAGEKSEKIVEAETYTNPISSQIANQIKEAMGYAADYNGLTLDTVTIGSKTGTAENSTDKTHAWYIGLAPLDNPQYVVTVMVENAGDTGYKVAAPIGLAIFKYLFPY